MLGKTLLQPRRQLQLHENAPELIVKVLFEYCIFAATFKIVTGNTDLEFR